MSEVIILIIIAVAVIVGAIMIALLKAAGNADRQEEKQYKALYQDDFIIGYEQKPPKLLTVGALVKWRGDVYEITEFGTYRNQTYATISDERRSAKVPVEDLEEVEE